MRTPKEPAYDDVEWKPWAQARMEELRAEVTVLAHRAREAEAKEAAARKRVGEQEQAIRGLEAWITNRRRKGLDVMAVGTVAHLACDPKVECRIAEVIVDRAGVKYLATWWEGARRCEDVLEPCEVKAHEDVDYLPLNPLERMPVGGYKEAQE